MTATRSRIASAAASRRSVGIRRRKRESAADRLDASEALFRDFRELTPYPYRPFARSFDSWDEYERWRRAQTNPWYR